MSLKLHQDHFAAIDEFEEMHSLYDRISHYHNEIFISHEVSILLRTCKKLFACRNSLLMKFLFITYINTDILF